MSFLNLSLAELLALFGAVSALTVALYLLDRSRRRQTVATLRFWVSAEQPVAARRRRIQQPWSLVIQLVSMLLLLLALAQMRWGTLRDASRDHVLLLDTSALMASQAGTGRLIDAARRQALAYMDALPASDRVMLVRTDALTTPATGFESDRVRLRQAVLESEPGATALHLDQALRFAREVRERHAARTGEIVYVGPGRLADNAAPALAASTPGLRVLRVPLASSNVGLRKVGLRRSSSELGLWEAFVSVHNDGSEPRAVPVVLRFGNAPVASQQVVVPGRGDRDATLSFRARAAGMLSVRLALRDALPDDNQAALELPEQRVLKVAVYSDEPELLRPLFATNPQVSAEFLPTAEYRERRDVHAVVLDRFRPAALPRQGTIWIEPPGERSPIPVRTTLTGVPLSRWRTDHPIGAGLRTKSVPLEQVQVFAPAPGDIPVADVEGGPVIVARSSPFKTVVFGFHPMRSEMRFELATPLLFANLLRWMEPDLFRQTEMQAGSVGSVSLPLGEDALPGAVRVVADGGQELPVTFQRGTVRFFTGVPGTVRVTAGPREWVYSLTLPEGADLDWQLPSSVRTGLPVATRNASQVHDLWPWLALAGGLGLLLEWLLFAGSSRRVLRPVVPLSGASSRWARLRGRLPGSLRRAS